MTTHELLDKVGSYNSCNCRCFKQKHDTTKQMLYWTHDAEKVKTRSESQRTSHVGMNDHGPEASI